jgi:hypothetical protein
MLAILETYTLTKAVSDRVILNNDITQQELNKFGVLKRFIRWKFLQDEYGKIINKSNSSPEFFNLTILFYDIQTGEIIPDTHRIPKWLRNFILEYKGNLDCYSLQPDIEFKYPLKFKYDPSKTINSVEFEILPRMRPFYPDLMSNCEKGCRYSKNEHENPSAISGFGLPGFAN